MVLVEERPNTGLTVTALALLARRQPEAQGIKVEQHVNRRIGMMD